MYGIGWRREGTGEKNKDTELSELSKGVISEWTEVRGMDDIQRYG